MNIFFEANGLVQNPNSEVGIFTYDDKTGYTTVNRDKVFQQLVEILKLKFCGENTSSLWSWFNPDQ